YCVVIVVALAVIVRVSVKAPEGTCPSSGILPHPKEYYLFYICQDGKSTIYKCSDGLHFNSTIKQCDWPSAQIDEEKADKSNCVGKYPILDPTDKSILLSYKDDCNKFSCSKSTPIILSCPSGLHFHEAEQICNWLWIANCPW
ncbi:Peritrophin-1, partial [Atta colombica]